MSDPRFELGPGLLERVHKMEARLAHLEGMSQQGILGTDQTVKGSHDRLDALMGAGSATPSATVLSGADSGVVMAHVARKQLVDNTATAVFRITTVNEAGGFSCYVLATPSHGLSVPASANAAAKGYLGAFSRASKQTGEGSLSAVTESIETASAATDAAARDVGAVTMTAAENSEWETDVAFTVDVTGTAAVNPFVNCLVFVVWHTYSVAPVITAL